MKDWQKRGVNTFFQIGFQGRFVTVACPVAANGDAEALS